MKLLPFVFAAVLFTACDKDDDDDPIEVRDKAEVAVIHVSPGTPALDVYQDTTKITASQIAYGSYSGTEANPYVEVNAGAGTFRVTNDGSTNFYQGNLSLAKDKDYSLFIYGVPDNGNVKTLLLEDAGAAPEQGNANIRFLHLAPDAPATSIYWINDSGDTVSNMSNIAYIGDSPNPETLSAFEAVPSGNYRVVVSSGDVALVDIPQVPVVEGKSVTFFAKGLVAGTGDQALGIGSVQHK